jgi:hypothetical protein
MIDAPKVIPLIADAGKDAAAAGSRMITSIQLKAIREHRPCFIYIAQMPPHRRTMREKMTRDEAYTHVCKAWLVNQHTGEAQLGTQGLLDLFVALGMLKLDEPKSDCETKLYYAMGAHYRTGLVTFKATLADAGLKVVEKSP